MADQQREWLALLLELLAIMSILDERANDCAQQAADDLKAYFAEHPPYSGYGHAGSLREP